MQYSTLFDIIIWDSKHIPDTSIPTERNSVKQNAVKDFNKIPMPQGTTINKSLYILLIVYF